MIGLSHLTWPFFEVKHKSFAEEFSHWMFEHLSVFDAEEGGDGKAARVILRMLGESGWLEPLTTTVNGRLDLRTICLMRELAAYRSAMVDVAISEPWLGILPMFLLSTRA